MRQVTIFGGSGFIGRHIAQALTKGTETKIVIATRRPERAYSLKPYGSPGQVVGVAYNPLDPESIAQVLKGSDGAVNCVGILAETRRQTFTQVHVKFPQRVARAAAKLGVQGLVHLSALGADKAASSDYAKSKAAGEQAVTEAFPKAYILRPSIVFGSGDGFFGRFGQMATLSPFLPLIGDGKTRFQPVFVGDIAQVAAQLLRGKPDKLSSRILELGGADTYTFQDLLRLILKVTGRRRLLLPIPTPVAGLMGRVMKHLPGQPLTDDQVRALETDNVRSGEFPGLQALGIIPTPLESMLPKLLESYAVGGRFAET